ncbi:hypothetical protein [uncultured Prevotella sp.]|uniref:hypothetical protein n=1 Tax=uncultured Prevotella sp. TaxID=159272 RepID=UPI00266B62C7|nr:hypothetical protein [uncultured Prevotella sp.]
MKNLQTGTTCLSKTTGSKQHKCERSLQRLATFVIFFLCSMTVSWAEGTTEDKTCDLVIKKGVKEYISFDNSITATCTKNPSSGFNFSKGGNDALTIKAKDATISNVSLWLKSDKSESANVEQGSQEVNVTNGKMTVKWTNGNKNIEFTYSGTKNFTIYGATITYKYDKNLKLDNVYAPKITPDETTVVGDRLDVQISDDQWEEAKAKNFDLKIHYLIEEGSNYGTGIVTNNTWTEVDKSKDLPLTINLTKTSTISAYAEYTNSNNEAIKSDVVSRTYFLLDTKTTYLNNQDTREIGETETINGMTMTYGGLKYGSENFTTLSKNENTDANILGSNHTVSGNALYGTKDAESELGDGNIGGTNTSHEYLHCNASNELHERTFALPAVGSFFKFEPDANGKLTVFVEQQGAIHNVSGTLHKDVVRKRPVYFLDETGKSIPANYAYTSSKVNKADWTKIQNTDNASNDNFYTKEYMDKLEKYYQNIIDGNNQNFTNFNSAVTDADKHAALTLGTSIQPIIVLHEECNADILKGDGMSMSVNGDDYYDNTGYMLISEGYVTYEFPVKAGKTYYLFASRTKLALSGFCFDKDADYKTENLQNVTLYGDKDNATTISNLTEGNQYNVTLNRSFGANKWYAVVLPFSVSQKQMKSVFGNDVKVLHYSDVTGTDLNLFEHFYQMIVGGTPVLMKPAKDVTNPEFNNVTLTSKTVVDIENTGFKCTGSWNNVDFPEYSYFIDAKTNSFYQYDPTKVETNTVKPHAGAFRSWVIASENASTAKQLTMHINGIEEQGETTAIWNAISGNDDAEVAIKGIYSLSGQRMNATDTRSLPKGIYIVNGKKFIVK